MIHEEHFLITREQIKKIWNAAQEYATEGSYLDLGETTHFINLKKVTPIGYRDGDGPVFQIREGSGESTKGLKRVYEMEVEE